VLLDCANEMTDRCFLATFHPLIHTAAGRRAVQRYGLPPFIDGSCRREPDFEPPFPSITATCRAGGFAPRLRPGDTVAYLTAKGTYERDTHAGWRLVAVLHVVERFESHDLAAGWYRSQGVGLPSNCIVEGNPPKPLELTNGNPPAEIKRRFSIVSEPERAVRLWDAGYRQRVMKWPVFLVCKASFLDLHTPPQVTESDLAGVFGRVPGMLNPPAISSFQLSGLLDAAQRTT
jgi:hypothetical protein